MLSSMTVSHSADILAEGDSEIISAGKCATTTDKMALPSCPMNIPLYELEARLYLD